MSARFIAVVFLLLGGCGGKASPAQGPTGGHRPASPSRTSAQHVRRIVVPAPPLAAELAPVRPRPLRVKLKRLWSDKNRIADDQVWFDQNGLAMPNQPAAEGSVPPNLDQIPLTASFDTGGRRLHLYELAGEGRSYLALERKSGGEFESVFDFSSYRKAPANKPTDAGLVVMSLLSAKVVGDVLYVCHAHRTYAESSKFKNAYVTALSLVDGKRLWRSQPLVCNAQTFVVTGPVLVTGYGFTAESDYLFALDRETGAVVAKAKLESGPSYVLDKGGELYIRTSDRDYRYRADVTE